MRKIFLFILFSAISSGFRERPGTLQTVHICAVSGWMGIFSSLIKMPCVYSLSPSPTSLTCVYFCVIHVAFPICVPFPQSTQELSTPSWKCLAWTLCLSVRLCTTFQYTYTNIFPPGAIPEFGFFGILSLLICLVNPVLPILHTYITI